MDPTVVYQAVHSSYEPLVDPYNSVDPCVVDWVDDGDWLVDDPGGWDPDAVVEAAVATGWVVGAGVGAGVGEYVVECVVFTW